MNASEKTTHLRIRHARETLLRAAALEGSKNSGVTIRVRLQLLEAARRRTGITGESALVTAGLALLAAEQDSGAWPGRQHGTLTDDFNLGL